MAKSPSIRDVAQNAGVSIGTASRALNNKSNVLPETRAQVLKAATELGYKIQFRVSSSVSTKLNTVGVVMKRDPGKHQRVDPFNYVILTGIESECQKLGISLMFSSIQVDSFSHAVTTPPILEDETIDGLIIVGAVLSDPQIAGSIPANMPIVLVDAYNPHGDCDSVQVDNFGGAYAAVTYLIQKGHRHIGLIGSDAGVEEHPSVRIRRHAYLKALRDNDISDIYIQDSCLWHDSAYESAKALITNSPEVTAIFTCNDDIVPEVIRGLTEMGRCVPDDVSIMGFDDTEVASMTNPKLTTMFVDKFLMGVMGVRQLYDRATNLDRISIKMTLRTRIVERDSVKSLVNRPIPENGDFYVPDT